MALCRHCNEGKQSRPRGLCWTCYYADGVRELYPSTSKCARRGVGNLTGDQPLPVPTTARPGTEAKIEVLAMRAALGQQLWHPDDAMGTPRKSKGFEGDVIPLRRFAA